MGMKEKMARAMYERMRSRMPGFDVAETIHAWENQSSELRADWLAATDAELDALMEPTEGMIEAGGKSGERSGRVQGCEAEEATRVFQAMILAAQEGE